MRCRSCCSAQFHIQGVVKLFSPHKQCYSHFGSYFCCFCNLLCLHLHLCSICMDMVCQLPFSSSSFLFSSSLLSQRGPEPFMQLSLYTCLWTGGERLSILREPTHTHTGPGRRRWETPQRKNSTDHQLQPRNCCVTLTVFSVLINYLGE